MEIHPYYLLEQSAVCLVSHQPTALLPWHDGICIFHRVCRPETWHERDTGRCFNLRFAHHANGCQYFPGKAGGQVEPKRRHRTGRGCRRGKLPAGVAGTECSLVLPGHHFGRHCQYRFLDHRLPYPARVWLRRTTPPVRRAG